MIELQSQPGVLLAIISVVCLACVFAVCLCCTKRSNIQQADNDLYDQDIDGSDVSSTLSESKLPPTVLRSHQTQRQTLSTSRALTSNRPLKNEPHWSYQNLPNASAAENGILEPTYVDPIPNALYANEDEADMDENMDTGTYENVFPTKEVQHDSDSCDYENSDFLAKHVEEESDYVNNV